MLLKPKDLPKRREPNPRVMPDGRLIFKKPSPKWTEQKFAAFQRDNGRCVMVKPDKTVCGRILFFNSGDPFRDAQTDHVRGKRMGRDAFTDDRLPNLRTTCNDCHRDRHDKGENLDDPSSAQPNQSV